MVASRTSLAALALLALFCGAQAGRPNNKWGKEAKIDAGLVKAYNGSRFALAPYSNILGGSIPIVLLQTNINIPGVVTAIQNNAIEALLTQYSERERFGPYIALGGLRAFGTAGIAPAGGPPTTPFFGLNTFLLASASGGLADLVAAGLSGAPITPDMLKSVAIGGVLSCIADVAQDSRVFAANIPLDILVGAIGGDIQNANVGNIQQAAFFAYLAVNSLCGQDPTIGNGPAAITTLNQIQSQQPAALFIGAVAPGERAPIPNGYVSVSKKGQEIEISQLGAKFELEREYIKQAAAVAPWFDLEAELTRKSNGQVWGLLAGERDFPFSFGGAP